MNFERSFDISISHAVAFLTRPLTRHISSNQYQLITAQLTRGLAARLSKASAFADMELAMGLRSGSLNPRCLTLSPSILPPPPILAACIAADFDWSDWARILGNFEFNLFVEVDMVAVQVRRSPLIVVWALPPPLPPVRKDSLLETLRKDDGSDLFAMIDYTRLCETTIPFEDTSIRIPPSDITSVRSASPFSRCTSPSSVHSDSAGSFSSINTFPSVITPHKMTHPVTAHSRRSNHSRVFVDKSKKTVTQYDLGRTNVLTGGVMLGPRRT